MIELQKITGQKLRRSFQPIDIEYLSCECRKYYSYVNGTKLFEGKMSFQIQVKKYLAAIIIILLLLIWAELGVGIFGTRFVGD